MRQKRTYRYRCYPTPAQAAVSARTFGCTRYVYNWALRLRTDALYERHERLGAHEASAALTTVKQPPETAWRNAVSSVPLQQALHDLDSAFRTFFEGRATSPAVKKKRGRQAATDASSAFRWDVPARVLTLAQMDAPLDIHWSRAFTGTPSTMTSRHDPAGRYFVSFLVEEALAALPVVNALVGVDVGRNDLAVFSSGEKIAHPQHRRRSERRRAQAPRNRARQQHGTQHSTQNRDNARLKVARVPAKIADQRADGRHNLSTRLIRENQTICVESLAVKNLVRHPRLAKAIGDVGGGDVGGGDVGWGELVRHLEYTATWYGRTLVRIDRWYPSSTRCHACGHILAALDLGMRQWTCPACGAQHDRDITAATNTTMLAVGLTVNAGGEAVRTRKGHAHPGTPQ